MTSLFKPVRAALAAALLTLFLSPAIAQNAPPRPLKQAAPEYPRGMARAGLTGAVKISFVIDTQGNVVNPQVVESNNPSFERPAIDAMTRWKFTPAEKNGRPVNTRAEQTIMFNLGPGGRPAELWSVTKGKEHGKLPPEFQWETPPMPLLTMFPVYPFDALQAGAAGQVKITYVVGPEGRVIGAKLTEATTPELGLAVLAMIDAWRFKPAKRKDGTTGYANLGSEYDFRPNGRGDVPVSDTALKILSDLEKKPGSFATLDELDQPLKPTSRRPPAYPTALWEAGQPGEAVIEFFVDRNGDAQLPRIISSTAVEFGYAAVQAVSTWRFEPPKKGGKTVVARVRIPVEFALREKKPAGQK